MVTIKRKVDELIAKQSTPTYMYLFQLRLYNK